jgi:hypothetical protein
MLGIRRLTFIFATVFGGLASAAVNNYDIVVYGGTCSGITAAIQAERMGKSVVLVCPEEHIGGLTISGLGWTDTKDTGCIGGLAREFYHRIWLYYNSPETWVYQSRSSYNANWQAGPAVQDSNQTMWTFEPHAAEEVFEQWLAEEGITVVRNRWLDRSAGGVEKTGNRITAIKTLSYDEDFGFTPAETYNALMFIDASYEGDLMASSGVSYRIGRDSRTEYNETLNGIYFGSTNLTPSNSPYKNISPYVVPADPDSGLIAQLAGKFTDMSRIGGEDDRLQSFNFRMCLTDVSANRVPIPQPEGYDESQYELLFRLYEAGQNPGFTTQRMPNLKCDNNNSGLMSLDWPGGNYSDETGWVYSEASYSERMNYVQKQRDYQQGLLWTMLYHPRVPLSARNSRIKWGLSADEFADNENWPYFSYIREARRMEGEMVMTEHHVKKAPGYDVSDSIGMGSYSLDSHVVRRVVIDGAIWDEGGFYQWWADGYPISYRTILPKQEQAANLFVPVCLSASHAAFGSIRMEPTYMILGQSAATAASIAIDYDYDVQDVPYGLLRTRLLCDKQQLGTALSVQQNAYLLNFGAAISNDNNSPAHSAGGATGTSWNLIIADTSSGIIDSNGNAVNLGIDIGKTQPNSTILEWDRGGFINSTLGADYNTGIYAGNARSAMYVNDGGGSHTALGVRVSGLNAGLYAIFTTAINTNTSANDYYNIYALAADADSGNTDFAGLSPALMRNTRETSAWLCNSNFVVAAAEVVKGQDLVIAVEGLAEADYRAFVNTIEIVQVAQSPLAPVISAEPQDLSIDMRSETEAVLSCKVKSPAAPSISWYKYSSADDDILMDAGSVAVAELLTGEFAATLTITNLTRDDCGQYYCVAVNEDGRAVSRMANVNLKEILAHYSLDSADYSGGKYTDLSGNARDAAVSGTPSFTAGADGKTSGAISLTSTSGSASCGAWNPSEGSGQMSISAWVFWAGGNQTSIIADKSNSWNSSQMMWTWGINPDTQRINFVSEGSSDFQTAISSAGFAQGQWHHLLITHDAANNAAALYVDTQLVNSGVVVLGTKTDAPLRIGSDAGGRYFNGRLDDVRIYNYVPDENGRLDAYNGAALVKKKVCRPDSYESELDISGPDGTPDCEINIYDILSLATGWLSSGLYPRV